MVESVKRLIDTSAGKVLLDTWATPVSLTVHVTLFDESGVESGYSQWPVKDEEKSLTDVIAEVTGLPRSDADGLATTLLEAQEGAPLDMTRRRFREANLIVVLLMVFVAAGAVALFLLAMSALT